MKTRIEITHKNKGRAPFAEYKNIDQNVSNFVANFNQVEVLKKY